MTKIVGVALLGLAIIASPAAASHKRRHCRQGYVRKHTTVRMRRHGHIVHIRKERCLRKRQVANPVQAANPVQLGSTPIPRPALTSPTFIVNRAVVNRTEAINPALAARYFHAPQALEIGGNTTSFADETKLEAALNNNTLPASTRAVIYDDEHWPGTPAAQQHDPATYYQRASQAAHQHGLLLIAAPGSNLVGIIDGTTGAARFDRYLELGIPTMAARYADVYAIQAQALGPNPIAYAQFVDSAAAQARQTNPGIEVIAGLSTNPSLPPVEVESASTLLADASATRLAVAGWWLNDPSQGTECPLCVGPFPQTVVDFLSGLS